MEDLVFEGCEDFSPEDVAFLNKCANMLNGMLRHNASDKQEQVKLSPIVEEDGSVNEASSEWSVNGSMLLVCLGRKETIAVSRASQKNAPWTPVLVPNLKTVVQKANRVDTKIRDLICQFVDCLSDWGYSPAMTDDNGYPIPTINFTKVDSAVAAVTLIEVTPLPSNRTVN